MQSTTRVAVIGGGVVGCSVLYHLTKLGWTDVMLGAPRWTTLSHIWAQSGVHNLA